MADPLSPPLHDYPAVRQFLYSLKHHGAKFGIDRMRLLAERLGHPERSYPVVHIAGTNGKGSVSAMLDAILRAAGHRTGLYTSPHLVRQGERVQVDRRILTEDEVVRYTQELQPIAAALGAHDPDDYPSFFEFMTAMAFLHFQRERVDIGIIETGLGGRLDATNVVQPELAVITSIGHDHMEILGDTLEKIAAEKAGIIKPGRPVVLGRLPREAEQVIRAVAAERAAPVASVVEHFGEALAGYPETRLEGSYQRINAATATLAARLLRPRFEIADAAVARGLAAVDWPGRWQHFALGDREIIFDASHNPEGAECLEENLARLVHASGGRRPDIVLGVLGVPRAQAIVPVAARYARSLSFVVVPHQPRACSHEELAACVPGDYTGEVRRTTVDALFPARRRCALGGPGETVVVTGSIYLLGEVMDRLLHDVPVGQGILHD
ncbi:MAG: bifunctional folylpolyglutamate synthase/dihydrofolate synthase [Opitutaceae bacterium]|nr:bifunctional folylpolyglutamate synthase/dihydrofolate synthase [Opitutaceae bacterium]